MLSRRLAAEAPAWLAAAGARGAAAKAGGAVAKVQPASDDGITTTTHGQAFVGDLRSTSALEVRGGGCGTMGVSCSAPAPHCPGLHAHELRGAASSCLACLPASLPQVGDGVFNHTKKWLQVGHLCRIPHRTASAAAAPWRMPRGVADASASPPAACSRANAVPQCAWLLGANQLLQGNHKSPMEYIQSSEPIRVHGLVVASYGCEWAQPAGPRSRETRGAGRAAVGARQRDGACCKGGGAGRRCSAAQRPRRGRAAGNDAERRCSVAAATCCCRAGTACWPALCRVLRHPHAWPNCSPAADDDPALGCPVEYINLKGTSRDNPAVCKYTGNK